MCDTNKDRNLYIGEKKKGALFLKQPVYHKFTNQPLLKIKNDDKVVDGLIH